MVDGNIVSCTGWPDLPEFSRAFMGVLERAADLARLHIPHLHCPVARVGDGRLPVLAQSTSKDLGASEVDADDVALPFLRCHGAGKLAHSVILSEAKDLLLGPAKADRSLRSR